MIAFYLRLSRFEKDLNDWFYQLSKVENFGFEVTAIEPATPNLSPMVVYLPLRMPIEFPIPQPSCQRMRAFTASFLNAKSWMPTPTWIRG